ncbi:hypothetical protein [Gryllotalpicola protaetiae]|uniref:hypothetical protein n=1 Tax=Gryllotalpicola protaetiae TaxID=2419771 RepID=UPI0013C430B9|nr:hypothetical protein [Gryllotalpicola protaetiae]
MPLEFELPDYFERPELVLASFTATVYEDLDSVVEMREALFLDRDVIGDVFDENLVAALEAIAEAWGPVADTRDSFVESLLAATPEVLSFYGLIGLELRAKIIGWEYARGRLEAALDSPNVETVGSDHLLPQPVPPVRTAGRLRRLLRAINRPAVRRVARGVERSLGAADVALGSAVKFIPHHEKLVEMKELLENLAGTFADQAEG